MQRLNIYKRTLNKPMIYSLECAYYFAEQTKVPLEIRMDKNKYIIVHLNSVKIVERTRAGFLGVDFVTHESYGDDAIADIYKLRKYINAYFRR